MVDYGQSDMLQHTPSMKAVKILPWKRDANSGIECLTLSALRKRKLDHRLTDPQRLKFHLLLFFTSGTGTHIVDFAEYTCRINTLIHISPNQVHSFGEKGDNDAIILIFREEILSSEFFGVGMLLSLSEYLWPTAVKLEKRDATFLTQLFHLLQTQQKAPGKWKQSNTARYLALSIASFSHQTAICGNKKHPAPTVYREYYEFRSLMESAFSTQHSAQWYAREVGCSYRTLCRVCESAVGLSPKTLLDERIAKEARRLLGFSSDHVYIVAEELGFSEPTNFVKFFQRMTGETPQAFRKKWRMT